MGCARPVARGLLRPGCGSVAAGLRLRLGWYGCGCVSPCWDARGPAGPGARAACRPWPGLAAGYAAGPAAGQTPGMPAGTPPILPPAATPADAARGPRRCRHSGDVAPPPPPVKPSATPSPMESRPQSKPAERRRLAAADGSSPTKPVCSAGPRQAPAAPVAPAPRLPRLRPPRPGPAPAAARPRTIRSA